MLRWYPSAIPRGGLDRVRERGTVLGNPLGEYVAGVIAFVTILEVMAPNNCGMVGGYVKIFHAAYSNIINSKIKFWLFLTSHKKPRYRLHDWFEAEN